MLPRPPRIISIPQYLCLTGLMTVMALAAAAQITPGPGAQWPERTEGPSQNPPAWRSKAIALAQTTGQVSREQAVPDVAGQTNRLGIAQASPGSGAKTTEGLSPSLPGLVWPQSADSEPPLPVEQAFRLQYTLDSGSGRLLLHWDISPGYYLYHDRLAVQADGQAAQKSLSLDIASDPVKLIDQYFGEVAVYYDSLDVSAELGENRLDDLEVHWQGCSQIHQLCYPPQQTRIGTADGDVTEEAESARGDWSFTEAPGRLFQDKLADQGGGWLIIMLMYLAGVALSFTPCVLPMIPILSGLLGISHQTQASSSRRLFLLGLTYVLAMALTYSVFGVVIAVTGQFFQAFIQHPVVVSASALLIFLMGLWMMGIVQLRWLWGAGAWAQNWQSRLPGGRYWTAVAAGCFSSLIVSPCVSAPLIAALVFISQTGNWVFGGSALLALGLGMGTPLMLVCLGMQRLLPRAGAWMSSLNLWLGVGLMIVALWLLERLVPFPVVVALLCLLLTASSFSEGVLDLSQKRASRAQRLYHGFLLLVLLYALSLGIGLLGGQAHIRQPLKSGESSAGAATAATAGPAFLSVANLDELRARLDNNSFDAAMLDIYADWCISCKELEHLTFADPRVSSRLRQLLLLRLDVTNFDAAHRRLFEDFALFGPPTILFFDAQGEEIRHLRQAGFVEAEVFARRLDIVIDRGQAPEQFN